MLDMPVIVATVLYTLLAWYNEIEGTAYIELSVGFGLLIKIG